LHENRFLSPTDLPMTNTFHYTDKDGWNGIRSQKVWHFKAAQPKDPNRPPGAYFTDIEPTKKNLRTLHKRIRVPKVKQEYVFWFLGTDGLIRLNDGRGRDKWILFSKTDYHVDEERQKYGDVTEALLEVFE
jgi:hypothetical protein